MSALFLLVLSLRVVRRVLLLLLLLTLLTLFPVLPFLPPRLIGLLVCLLLRIVDHVKLLDQAFLNALANSCSKYLLHGSAIQLSVT